MAKPTCGRCHPGMLGVHCEREANHEGLHRARKDAVEFDGLEGQEPPAVPDPRCDSRSLGYRCEKRPGHEGAHEAWTGDGKSLGWGQERVPVARAGVVTMSVADLASLAARESSPLDPTAGRKFDQEKPRWDLLPLGPIAEVVDVLTIGAKKYAPDNWRHVPDSRNRYFAAAMRHLTMWRRGERIDPETGHNHLAHALCCVVFLLAFDQEGGAK